MIYMGEWGKPENKICKARGEPCETWEECKADAVCHHTGAEIHARKMTCKERKVMTVSFKDWWRSSNFKDDESGANKAMARAAWYAGVDNAPALAEDSQDAIRYRWLKTHWEEFSGTTWRDPTKHLDGAVDASRARSETVEQRHERMFPDKDWP